MEQERRKGKAYATSAKCGKVAGREGEGVGEGLKEESGGRVSELGVAGADCLLEFQPFRHLPFAAACSTILCVCVWHVARCTRCTLHACHLRSQTMQQLQLQASAGGGGGRRRKGSKEADWECDWRCRFANKMAALH